jgi:hypothetical protein
MRIARVITPIQTIAACILPIQNVEGRPNILSAPGELKRLDEEFFRGDD